MNKAEEATNDFCTRCFKYNKCTKVKSECVMADSYQEGYEDGYHQAEKDILSEYGWLILNVKNLKLKYCHNREAVEAVEDVCDKLYKFKTDIEHG